MDWARLTVSNKIQEDVLEELREKLAKHFGVTVNGPYVTVRWKGRSVSMIATSIDSGETEKGVHPCEANPGKVCEYSDLDPSHDQCVFCGEPHERK